MGCKIRSSHKFKCRSSLLVRNKNTQEDLKVDPKNSTLNQIMYKESIKSFRKKNKNFIVYRKIPTLAAKNTKTIILLVKKC